MAADCSNRLRTIAKCHAELERLQALLDSGHPDVDGIQRGIEDWIHEEVIILSEMTREQEQHLASQKAAFIAAFDKKYRAGQREHGGNLWEMPAERLIHELKQEALDLWAYADALEAQLMEAACSKPRRGA